MNQKLLLLSLFFCLVSIVLYLTDDSASTTTDQPNQHPCPYADQLGLESLTQTDAASHSLNKCVCDEAILQRCPFMKSFLEIEPTARHCPWQTQEEFRTNVSKCFYFKTHFPVSSFVNSCSCLHDLLTCQELFKPTTTTSSS